MRMGVGSLNTQCPTIAFHLTVLAPAVLCALSPLHHSSSTSSVKAVHFLLFSYQISHYSFHNEK